MEETVTQTIVVLEDEVDIARLVQYHLEGGGVCRAAVPRDRDDSGGCGAAAAGVVSLLDIMVPGGDGMDLCRRLRKHPVLSSVPIIFLTARAGENDRVQGLELGADD